MDNYTLIELLQQEMRKAGCDSRAESQLSMALQKGLSPDDFMVLCDSLFHREYSKDVARTELKEDVRKKHLLEIHLSRSGIYDQLPEGLFFQPEERRGGFNATDMVADHKLNKKKEEEIRRFFLPFENDFFWQRLQIEREEARLLEGLQSDILNEYFSEFWNIPDAIPLRYVVQLILLLPHAYKIAGNLSLTAQSLEHLLEEQVMVQKIKPAAIQLGRAGSAGGLGESQLGLDMVCGEQFVEDFPAIEIVIGPLIYSRVSDYLEGGDRNILVETFTRFFVPAGVDTQITIDVPAEKQNMTLAKGKEPILGYSSVL
ncbi:MAG TPA: type VI secretion system baseplate subunit TssG [Puia sp.]|nr:type VI secretion system baseplate subunit TssG [Puia sp.]